jgi:hypothetical protein
MSRLESAKVEGSAVLLAPLLMRLWTDIGSRLLDSSQGCNRLWLRSHRARNSECDKPGRRFGRTADRDDGTPRFSPKGAKSYLYEYDGYSGGHPELDRIIELLKSNCVRCDVSGADSPMNVANYEYEYHFDDGGFAIYSGNYFFGTPGRGAFVLGFKAFR